MPKYNSNQDDVDLRIKKFMDGKMDKYPDLKSMNIKEITDYIEY